MGFKINRVYTRSGDSGDTALVDGSRVSKKSLRCEAYGTLDELNSWLGLCKLELNAKDELLSKVFEYLQQELFDLGSELATPSDYSYPGMWKVSSNHVQHLEDLCDYFNESLPELNSFILPGGSRLSTSLHCARTVARRAERVMVTLRDEVSGALSGESLQYINRLSDLLFILSRFVLESKGLPSSLWVQEKERVSPLSKLKITQST